MNKDLNYIAALEKAISEKYGDQAIKHPKSDWNEEKEKIYLQQSSEKLKKELDADLSRQQLQLDGILIAKKLISSDNKRKCEYCNKYSFNRNDDLFFTKFDTCYKCYVEYVEDREERWQQGWRPNKSEQI